METKIIDSIWFETNIPGLKTTIGIVATRDKITNNMKFYIGLSKGDNIDIDEKTIIEYGSLFYPPGIDLWLRDLEEMDQYYEQSY